MKRIFVVDTSTLFTPSQAQELGVHLLPLGVSVDQELYRDQYEITNAQVWDLLAKGADLKTSQPNMFDIEEALQDLSSQYDEVICIMIPEVLSGTKQLMMVTARTLELDNVYCYDLPICNGAKIAVLEALKMADQPRSALEELFASINNNTQAFLHPSSLEQLKKGGRISAATAAVGNMLKIKVLLKVTDEQRIEKFATTRTTAKLWEQINNEFVARGFSPAVHQINLLCALAPELQQQAADYFLELYPDVKISIMDLPSVIVAHTGTNAIAVQMSPIYE